MRMIAAMRQARVLGTGRWLAAAAALVALTAGPVAAGTAYEWTVAAYLSGDGDLRGAAHRYLDMVARGADRPGWAAAVQLDETGADGTCAARRHVWGWQGGERHHRSESVPGGAAGVNMGAQETLSEFLRWVRVRAPADRYALIIMGHGTSVAAPGASLDGGLANSGVALDTSAGGDCLSAVELAGAIETAFAETQAPGLDALFLDCCYGGCLEVAYELRDAVRYVTGAPGEIPNPGLRWDVILDNVSRESEADAREVVGTCLRVVREQNCAQAEPISLTAIDLSGMSQVGASFRAFAGAATGRMAEIAPAITLARSGSAIWGSQRELCDAAGLMARMGEALEQGDLATAAQAAARAVRDSVVGQVGEQAERSSGIAIFFPGTLSDVPRSYDAERCSFAGDSGWAPFLRAYVQRLRDLMQRTAEGEEGGGDGSAPWPQVASSGPRET
jgi:hypothetical protein